MHIDLNANDDTEIEHEFISHILFIFDTNWVTKDSIPVFGIAYRDVSVAEALPRYDVLAHCFEVEEAGLVNSRLRYDASWWALMDNLGPFAIVRRSH
jgi:hypothetical protein